MGSLRVGITGSSGLIGTALRRVLDARGDTPVPIVRRAAADGEIEWDPIAGRLDPAQVADLDAVVNLAGAGIGDRRWSDAYRKRLRSSRIDGTALIARTFADLGDAAPGVLVNASAVGYYGDRGDEELAEPAAPGTGFLADLCRDWEAAAAPAESTARVLFLRSGIVLDRDAPALTKMLPPFRFGVGGRFGSGAQWLPWIMLHDATRAIVLALTSDLSGPVNLVAPAPVTNREFTDALGRALHRPSKVPVPAFALKLVLGGEMAQALLLDSARVVPAALADAGFEFEHPDIDAAFAAIFTN